MSKANNVRRHYYALEKSKSVKDTQKSSNQSFFPKHLKKVYPIGLQKSSSSLSLSSLSLSLSQNSNDSSLTADSLTPLDQKMSLALRLISPCERREPSSVPKTVYHHHHHHHQQQQQQQQSSIENNITENGELRRCNWITKNSDKAYIEFHDECWGVPAYDDNKLFELLALSGLLMGYNWTEILKKKEILREVFAGFDPSSVAKMEEKDIMEIASNKALSLADSRIVRECGSFSSYIWSHVNHKPTINRYKFPRNVPLRSPKAETISKDLIKRGFRFVGPVIVHSFMQAAGLTIDHLVDCYRHTECVSLAERPWRHI
ncbi:putative GMP synthase [glutamine-hydrolyzing] [Senna tora]|uniref:Putative GMP synthase [glutamine-hydrolyzing] n=1 Tax=Senna tora TaxID=362788 RepID=A0A834TTK5_9FABA|nr:putative GMP synthase [glutamine-hydrolyzing] [Senna tora]